MTPETTSSGERAALALTGVAVGVVGAEGEPPPRDTNTYVCTVDGEFFLDFTVDARAAQGLERAFAAIEERHPADVECGLD